MQAEAILGSVAMITAVILIGVGIICLNFLGSRKPDTSQENHCIYEGTEHSYDHQGTCTECGAQKAT